MRFRPCIDIHEGQVKQIVGSTLSDTGKPVVNFETTRSPAYFAELYRKDEFSGGHVIMLGKGNEAAAKEALRAYPGGLQVGGGITPENAESFLESGASHVIVTSYVFKDGKVNRTNLEKISQKVGKNRLVLDCSCKRSGDGYVIVTDRWQKETDELLTPELFSELEQWCDEFLVHAAHVEGMRSGIDETLVRLLVQCTSRPVTYAGGVSALSDCAIVQQCGNNRIDITVGSALDLFGGSISYESLVQWFHENGDTYGKR